ncbi:MAG: tRNA (adenosine(37)-N6)-threonylcarbamoyltransferase complex transferase subunit TsaD [Candidatus Ratteibacteria bacterium]|jgi:N6-L-threonylcarbamoyladenine synthase
MIILGIESSCDETAVALVADGRVILASEVASQDDIHSLYGGVVPELASRQHLEVIVPLFKRCLRKSGISSSEISAVTATTAPGLSGSLLVGDNFGRAVALALEIPFVSVNHIEAHLAANFFPQLPEFPALGLVVSGGHSSLFLVSGPNNFRVLGETRDDAAGETFDKIARVLSLPYPGGPPLEKLAATAETAIRFPLPGVNNSYDFSFSGLKTAVVYYLKEHPEADKAAVAAGFQNSVVKGLVRKLDYTCNRHKVRSVLTGGGVLANNFLRCKLKEWAEEKGMELRIPSIAFSLDNAVMVAVRGFYLC